MTIVSDPEWRDAITELQSLKAIEKPMKKKFVSSQIYTQTL